MSARTEAQADLQSRADALDQLTTAVVVLDEALHVRYLNPAAEALFGTSRQHRVGAHVRELTSEGIDGLSNVFTTGQSITQRAAKFRTRDGRELSADLTASLEPEARYLLVELLTGIAFLAAWLLVFKQFAAPGEVLHKQHWMAAAVTLALVTLLAILIASTFIDFDH